jgi:hypothetical protein
MQIDLATISDIQAIARREALNAGRKILGITVDSPRYVLVPNDQDVDAVLEFVVDVFLLEHASQAVTFFGDSAGLKRINNVLVATSAIGDLISDLNTPVEIELSRSGQLQVVSRAKVNLSTVVLDFYDLRDLSIGHCSELKKDSTGTWRDAFGVPYLEWADEGFSRVGVSTSQTNRQSTLGELGLADNLVTTGQFGINTLQRTITTSVRSFSVLGSEPVGVQDTSTQT